MKGDGKSYEGHEMLDKIIYSNGDAMPEIMNLLKSRNIFRKMMHIMKNKTIISAMKRQVNDDDNELFHYY